jgi:hypothetical protein
MTQFPVIHINGSHGPTLLAQYEQAVEALHKAIAAVSQIECHGRDYYPLATATGPDPAVVAYREHIKRRQDLDMIHCAYQAIAFSIANQIKERDERNPALAYLKGKSVP